MSSWTRFYVALVAALATGCGAGDKLSDAEDPTAARCRTLEEIAPTFLRLVREDRFAGLRAVLEGDMSKPLEASDPNGPTRLSALVGIVLEVVRAVDVPGFRQVLLDALRSTEAGPLLPQAVGLFRWIDGRVCPGGAPSCAKHYGLIDVVRRLLFSQSCDDVFDARVELDLLARLVSHPRLTELLDLFPRLLSNPTFRSTLRSFRFESCPSPPCEQENGFAALLDVLLDNVLVPGIPWDDIGDLLRQVRLDTPEVRDLLTIAEELLTERPASAELDVLGPLRGAIRCLRRVDPGRVLARDLYGALSTDDVSLDGLAAGVDNLLDADPDRLTLRVVAQALDYFRARALGSFRTLQIVLDVMLTPGNAERLVPVLISVVEAGAVPELTNVLLALTGDCTTL